MKFLCVLTAFHGRPRVSALYWAGIRRAAAYLAGRDIQLQVAAIVSDEENAHLANGEALLTPQATIAVAWADNQPLASKFNAMSQLAATFIPDACVLVDSDDLLSDDYWATVVKWMEDGVSYAGLLDFHVYDLATKRIGHWAGYPPGNPRHGETIGVGRYWSRQVLEAMNWKLWPESDRPSGLDGISHRHVSDAGFSCVAFACAALPGHVIALDLKSDVNMWSYDRLPLLPADPDLLTHFPELT